MTLLLNPLHNSTFFVFLFVLLLPLTVAAEVSKASDSGHLLENEAFIRDAQTAINLVYNYQYKESIEVLDPWREAYPEHPLWVFWEGLPVWWQILSDLESEQYDKEFIRIMEETGHACDLLLRRDRRNLDAMVLKSVSSGFLARLHSNRHSWYNSFSQGRVAMNLLFTIEQIYPEIADLQFGLGLYHYFAAFLREEYTLVRAVAWMLPGGDKEDGLRRLKIAAEESAFVVPESRYFLGHIYLHYERDFSAAMPYLKQLSADYPNNPFFQRLLLRTHFRNQNFTTAAAIADSLILEYEETARPPVMEELLNTRGRLYYRMNNLSKAEDYFRKALDLSVHFDNPGKRRLQAEARYFLAQTLLKSGRETQGKNELQTIVRNRPDSPYLSRARRELREL